MVVLRPADERGHADHGWLDSWHSFSFAEYWDPEHMGFRALRVINEDTVAPGGGFPTHPHRDMEIVTYVVEGALEHRDSTGTGSVIRRGDVQRMTAGTGVAHSEVNASREAPVHLLQIWLVPERRGLRPSYDQRAFSDEEKRGRLRLLAARDGRDGALSIHQDVDLYATLLDPGQAVELPLRPGRHGWVQVVRGAVTVNGRRLDAGDGAAVSGDATIRLEGAEPAEALLFDLA